jgi:LuxR family maltose regulon positive regulatory protein
MNVIRHNLPANLTLPHLNRNTVANPNLPSWLEDCVHASLVLAVAPAGFGKTTAILALHEHLREAGIKTAWIQLNPDDNHLDRFCQLIYAAIAIGTGKQFNNDEIATNLIDAAYTSTSFNFKLLDLVANLPNSTTIFLDDFDHITDPQILQIVQSMIERSGNNCRFIIAARAQPKLKLLKLRAQGKVVLIGFRELAFDIEQTRTFFNARYQLQLDDASIERLHQCTEGWPTGLQLAALAMSKHKNRQNFIRNFLTSATDIDHYLYEEVFLTQSQEVQNFLLKASIVRQLNSSLMNAVAEIQNSATLLRNIEQQNLFLVRVGESDVQYRFHPLFAEYLQKKLHEDHLGLEAGLHTKAAEWYLNNDDLDSAIDHVLLAGEYERACEILSSSIWARINAGKLSDCHRWLSAIHPPVLEKHSDLLLAKCWVHIFQHEYILARNLAYHLRTRTELQNNNDYRILEPLTLALMDQIKDCENVLVTHLNNVTFSGPVAGVLHSIRAKVYMGTNQFHKISSEIDLAKAIFRQYGSLYGLSYAIGIEANVLLIQAKITQAIALLETSFADIVARSGKNSVCSAHLAGYLAEALYEAGDYERAFNLADDYFDLTCATGMTYTIIASFRLLSRSRCNTGNYQQAKETTELGIKLGQQLNLQSVLTAMKLEQQYQLIQHYDAQSKELQELIPLPDLAWNSSNSTTLNGNYVENIHIMQFRIWIRTGKSQHVVNDAPHYIVEANQCG